MRRLFLLLFTIPVLCQSQNRAVNPANELSTVSDTLIQNRPDAEHAGNRIRSGAKESAKSGKTFAVFNATGQEVMSGSFGSSVGKLQTAKLSSGVYVVQVTDGAHLSTFRLVKK